MEEQRNLLKNTIKNQIIQRFGDELSYYYGADEVIDAIAYACTFTASRTLAGRKMTSKDWQKFADEVTLVDVYNVIKALTRFKGGNRLFYILGCAARLYNEAHPIERERRRSPYERTDEKIYTQSELRAIANSLGPLDPNDL